MEPGVITRSQGDSLDFVSFSAPALHHHILPLCLLGISDRPTVPIATLGPDGVLLPGLCLALKLPPWVVGISRAFWGDDGS